MMPSVLRYEMILIAVAFMLIVFRTVESKKIEIAIYAIMDYGFLCHDFDCFCATNCHMDCGGDGD